LKVSSVQNSFLNMLNKPDIFNFSDGAMHTKIKPLENGNEAK